MSTLNFKEGQTYVCTKSEKWWWTEGKEYKVVLTSHGIPALSDNDGDEWSSTVLNLSHNQFKLKEKPFDLNTLTTAQLREYVDLLEDKEESERLLNDFIERMSN